MLFSYKIICKDCAFKSESYNKRFVALLEVDTTYKNENGKVHV